MKAKTIGQLKKRVAAAVLAAVLAVSAMPAAVFADDDTPAAAKTWDILNGQTPVTEGKAQSATYILEVSTGTSVQGTTADNVMYFSVYYTDVNGKKHTEIIMPGIDAVERGFDEASKVGARTRRIRSMQTLLGYTLPDLNTNPAMGSVQTDQFLFMAPAKVAHFDKIQVFGKKTNSRSDWVCQGMRIFSVDTLYGLDMYGWYSQKGYIDFAGKVAAEVGMNNGGGIFRWENSGGTFNIVGMNQTGGTAGVVLVNDGEGEAFTEKYHLPIHVGMEHTSQSSKRVLLRLDLADTGDGGFEALAGRYSLGSRSKMTAQRFCECASIIVRYTDVFGCQRDVTLPVIANSLGPVYEMAGDLAICGYAQQGDTLAIPALLPDFVSINNVTLVTGEAAAAERTGLVSAASNELRAERAAASDKEKISLLSFSAYTAATCNAYIDGDNGATLMYDISAGDLNPGCYSTATSIEGTLIDPGSPKNLSLTFYNASSKNAPVLKPTDRMDRYLITMSTDNVLTAGTISDLSISFNYETMKGKEATSAAYSVKDYVRSFYGDWPGNVVDFAYQYGLSQGSTVQFMIPMQGINKFTGVNVKLEGNDEWQFSGINIAKVASYTSHKAVWEEVRSTELMPDGSGPRFLSHVRYSRTVIAPNVSFSIGTVYPPGSAQPDPTADGSTWTPGSLIQDDDMTHTFDGKGSEVDKQEDIDWSQYIHYMTYADTKQKLGFTKGRCTYNVTVNVAGDKTNEEDDDCGSRNLFYFQLVFENGNSGCTLANQQIVGDAFRTGTKTEFKITTSQDYGELSSIRVLADNQDGNGDIYDKLKIRSIEVMKETNDALSPTWVADCPGEDGKGSWVGIKYQDPGEIGSIKGAQGHSMGELFSTYLVTESSYTAKFLVAISTGPYPNSTGIGVDGQTATAKNSILAGGLQAGFSYFDTDGNLKFITNLDAVGLMNEYAGRTGKKVRTVQLEGEDGNVDYYVSDPAYQFRPSTTDYFFVSVKDLYEFVNMDLTVRSDVVTDWNISSVDIYMVRGTGTRYINAYGEYGYRYAEGETPKLLTSWNRDENLIHHFNIYRKLQDTVIENFDFAFELKPVEVNSQAGAWSSTIAREPKSKDDTFNLYLYPSTADTAAAPKDYDLTAAIRFTDGTNLLPRQTSTGSMQLGVASDGSPVFYALGLNAKNFLNLNGVDVKSESARVLQSPIRYGILQRVRSGVLMETYYLGGIGNADLGASMTITDAEGYPHKQRVYLQVDAAAAEQLLEPEQKDLAVALHFRSDHPGAQVLRSRYTYLSDIGVDKIQPGQLIAMDFEVGAVTDITGLNLVSLGGIEVPIEGVSVVNMDMDGNVLNEYSIQESILPKQTASQFAFSGAAKLLNLEIETATDDASSLSGTKDPISMTVGYYDVYGVLRTEYYPDIRSYVRSGRNFEAGSVDVINLLVPGMDELRWIEFEPRHTTGTTPGTWRIAKLTASAGADGRKSVRILNQMIIEGTPIHIGLAEVLVTGSVLVNGDDPSTAKTVSTGESLSRLMNSGGGLSIGVGVYGSTAGYKAKIENFDPDTGATEKADLNETHGYTRDYLIQLISSAEAAARGGATAGVRQAAKQVAEIANAMLDSYGTFTDEANTVRFQAPRNYSGRDKCYRITVYSNEMNDVLFTVDVKVYAETEQLTNAINLWRTEEANAPAPAPSTDNTQTDTPAETPAGGEG
ncbi:MAG: hypothetical protein J6A42_05040 [Firmicutes bacterium]|nr:hypothetical protein [Bacillota bacterium]